MKYVTFGLWCALSTFLVNVSGKSRVQPIDKRQSHGKYLRPCYFTNWAQYRQGRGKYVPEDYIPGLCTHLLFAFGWMNQDFTVRAYDPADLTASWSKGMYERLNDLKKIDPNLKTLLSIGGWTFGTALFKSMTATVENRKIFINSALAFVREHEFDGLDLDWEYPQGQTEMNNFSTLMKELRLAFEEEARRTSKSVLLLAAAVSAAENTISQGYDIPELAKYLDFVDIMSYDFHGAWEMKTGMNSPLVGRHDDEEAKKDWNVQAAAKIWADKGMPKEKIIIGMPTYGRGWTLKDTSIKGLNAPAVGPARATQFVQEAGVASYYEICEMLSNKAERVWDNQLNVPYLVHEDQWFSYDDEDSFRIKLDWIKQNGYGGAFIWTLDFDDFNGHCSSSNKKYPLLSVIAEELKNPTYILPPVPPPAPAQRKSTSTTNEPTSFPSTAFEQNSLCGDLPDGFHSSPFDCTQFFLCVKSSLFTMYCPPQLEFSSSLGYCVYPTDSQCKLPVQSHPVIVDHVLTSTTTLAPHIIESSTLTADGQCPSEGFFPDPKQCNGFYRCYKSVAYKFTCPSDLYYNPSTSVCDSPVNVNCQLSDDADV